jgi:quinol-cytochrome oxidoreductase complex cytochrome b subunit
LSTYRWGKTDKSDTSPNSPYYTTLDSYGLSLGVLLLLLALFLVVLFEMRRRAPPFIGSEEGLIPWNILDPYMESAKPTSGSIESGRNLSN